LSSEWSALGITLVLILGLGAVYLAVYESGDPYPDWDQFTLPTSITPPNKEEMEKGWSE